MGIWLQLIVAAFALARELVKYANTVEDNKKIRVEKIKSAKHIIRNARKTKDTSNVEDMLSDVINNIHSNH